MDIVEQRLKEKLSPEEYESFNGVLQKALDEILPALTLKEEKNTKDK